MHRVSHSGILGSEAYVYRPIVAIKIEPVEGEVGDDPICNIPHVFVVNDEVACGPKSFTNRVALLVDLVRGMLIEFTSDSCMDMFRKPGRAKTVGEPNCSKVFNGGIQQIRCQVVDSVEGFGFAGQVFNLGLVLSLTTFDEISVSKVQSASLIDVRNAVTSS